jgi:hypothetical protein
MIAAMVTLDSQSASESDFEQIVHDGEVVRARGVLNKRWEDFSAAELARETGLKDVEWDIVQDDTPGSLSLTIEYPSLSGEDIEARLKRIKAVEDYSLSV